MVVKSKKKVYCTWEQTSYARPLLLTGEWELTQEIKNADLVIFTGGEDVSPHFYGENPGKYTNNNYHRDKEEEIIFALCVSNSIPMVGICRGAQFLCVMSGGKLVQHVSGHGVMHGHDIKTYDGKEFNVTSTHHQMMLPYGHCDFKLLGWADHLSKMYLNGDNEELPPPSGPEAEVVYFPTTNVLCFQYHPEYMNPQSDAVKYFLETTAKYLKGELK